MAHPRQNPAKASSDAATISNASRTQAAACAPRKKSTTAAVVLGRDDKGPVVENITLNVEAVVPGVSAEQFNELAEKSKAGCPISRALASTPITLNAKLVG